MLVVFVVFGVVIVVIVIVGDVVVCVSVSFGLRGYLLRYVFVDGFYYVIQSQYEMVSEKALG